MSIKANFSVGVTRTKTLLFWLKTFHFQPRNYRKLQKWIFFSCLENAVPVWDTGKLAKNIKIICLQTPIWKVSCHRSIISGLLGSFNGKWQGFSMVCSESELRLVDIVYISWLNKISSKGQIGSTCMGPLASEITFAKKKIISRSKTALVLARIEFWKNST